MKKATEKQIQFFLALYPKWKTKLKQEYRYYSIDATADFIDNVHRYLVDEEPVKMAHMTIAINDMKKALNG